MAWAARARAADPRRVDAVFGALLAIDLVLEAALVHGVTSTDRLVTAVFALPFSATVVVRRRWPAGAVVACATLGLAQQLFGGRLFTALPSQSAELAPILCAYGAGAWLARRRGAIATALAIGLLYADALVASYVDHASGAPGWSGGLALVVSFLLVPWVIGCFVRERTRRAAAFAALEAQVTAERSERERAAIAQERIVIGRELQDIIAHSVSVMVIQAGGARQLLGHQPERAREGILNVERTGREALAEMRRLLGLLRKDDDPRALAPQPGLDQLPELADSLHQAGLECQLREEGEPIDLTPGISLVGYRVVQAALRGAAQNGCTAATATVRYGSRGLELEVSADRTPSGIEQALRTVSERVLLYGGRLDVLGHESDGFKINCRLPLERVRA